MKLVLICFLILFLKPNFAQNPFLLSQQTFGGNNSDASSVILKNDSENAFYLVGYSFSDSSFEKSEDSKGGMDLWIVKTTEGGSIIWDKTIGGSAIDGMQVASLIKNDYLYVLASSTSPISGDKTAELFGFQDYWLICFDLEGNLIWDRSYGGDQVDIGNSIIEMSNGNILIAGASQSGIAGNKTSLARGESDYWILEVDPLDGSIIRQKSFGTNTEDYCAKVIEDEMGNIYLVGLSNTGVDGDKTDEGFGSEDVWILKLDSDFNIIMDKCFGGSGLEIARGDVLIVDDFLYLFTDSNSPISGNKSGANYGSFDYWLVKMDLDLNLIWDKSFGGSNIENARTIIDQPADKIILVGTSSSTISGNKSAELYGDSRDIWMIIVDKDGNEVRQESYGGLMDDWGTGIVGDDHGLLYLLGGSESNIGGLKTEDCRGLADYWLLKLDATDFLSFDKIELENGITVYPNPYTNTVNFVVGAHSEPLLLSLYSLDGKIVFQTLIPTEINHFVWDSDTEMNQILIFEIRSNDGLVTGKLVRGY